MAGDTFHLPPEIWVGICDRLSLPDIASFRLSCRAFGDVGAQFVVCKVTIRMETDDFARLRTLANDRALSEHVQSLLYTPNVYCLVGPGIPPTPNHGNPTPPQGSTRVEAEYKQVCEDQVRIQDNGLESALFIETLPKLTGLQRVVINSDGWPLRHFRKKPLKYTKGDWRTTTRRHPGSSSAGILMEGPRGV